MPKDTKTLCIKKGCASVLTQPPVLSNQLLYLLNAAYNDAACTPSTPAIAPATAMITFKTTLQVFFIDFSSFLF